MQNFKQSFLSCIIFSWTVIFSLVWFTVYAGSFDWVTSMSQTWFNLVNSKLNWTYTSWKMCTRDATWQIQCITDVPAWNTWLWIWQTRQNVTASRTFWTTYTNNTGNPIIISISVLSWWWSWLFAIINWYSMPIASWYWSTNMTWIFIVPNLGTYSITANWSLDRWSELR